MFGKMQHKVESIRNSIPICQVYENRVIFVLISTEKERGGGLSMQNHNDWFKKQEVCKI